MGKNRKTEWLQAEMLQPGQSLLLKAKDGFKHEQVRVYVSGIIRHRRGDNRLSVHSCSNGDIEIRCAALDHSRMYSEKWAALMDKVHTDKPIPAHELAGLWQAIEDIRLKVWALIPKSKEHGWDDEVI